MPSASLIITSVLGGIGAHTGIFIRGEWHLHVAQITFCHLSIFGLGCALVARHEEFGLRAALCTTVILFCCYLESLWCSIIAYRVLFHPLRHFPGPKFAGVTKLWHVWQSRNSKNHLVMAKLHDDYGATVRTGPNEISIFHPAGIELLDGPKNNNTKDVWYDIMHPKLSMVFCRDEKEIMLRRPAWRQGIATKCLKEYGKRIVCLGDDMFEYICTNNDHPIKLNDPMSWFAYDVMGLISYGQDFNMVKSRETKKELRDQTATLAMMAPMNDAIWLIRLGFVFFPWLKEIRSWFEAERFCCARMEQQIMSQSVDNGLSMTSFFTQEYQPWSVLLGHVQTRTS